MEKKITISIDSISFNYNRIFDTNWAKKFPGSMSFSVLAQFVQKAGFDIVTADVALSHVKAGYWDARDVLVAQDMDSPNGLELIKLGSVPKVLISFESPVFAYPFYDSLATLAPQFEHRILFKGAFESFSGMNGQNHTALFPVFHSNQKVVLSNWKKRKFLVMVANNKYWGKPVRFPLSFSPRKYAKWARKRHVRKTSQTLKTAIENELQSKRLEAIEYFGLSKRFDLFGLKWHKLTQIPTDWQKRLNNIIPEINPQPCPYEDKIKTISNYKFAICFENVSYPGYVTEKIFDCFAAGVIPVYIGAPDICSFVPENSFIDLRKFDSWNELNTFMDNISENDAMDMIAAGHEFLRSPRGQMHSYESFAHELFEMLTS